MSSALENLTVVEEHEKITVQSFYNKSGALCKRITDHHDVNIRQVLLLDVVKLNRTEEWFIDEALVMRLVYKNNHPATKQSWPTDGTPGFNDYYADGEWKPFPV